MKIRTDFVSNSSSTSFILIVEGEWSIERLGELMGIPRESPLWTVVEGLFYVVDRGYELDNYYERKAGEQSLGEALMADFSKEVADRVLKAKERGASIKVGRLRSDGESIEQFMCTESFELENEDMYLNGLCCTW